MTSATGGYLVPGIPQDGADAVFHGLLAGITGLPGNKVIAAYQGPKNIMPDNSVDWVSFWVETVEPDQNPSITTDGLARNESVALNVYTYGPRSREYMRAIIDGLTVKQNLEAIMAQGYVYIRQDTPSFQRNELFNNQWYRRFNSVILFGRHESVDYGILPLVSSSVEVFTEGSAALALLWLELDHYLTNQGEYFPVDAPSESTIMADAEVAIAAWEGVYFTREIIDGVDGGWNRYTIRTEVQGRTTDDGLWWMPADAAKTIAMGDDSATLTAEWGDGTYIRAITGIGTDSITDTGWVRQ